jgi:hypothetical protein
MADSDSDYITLDELKEYLGVSVTDDTLDDTYSLLITSASRHIEGVCNRRFYTPTSDETRSFDIPSSNTLWFDEDLVSITSITNGDGNAIPATDYILLPANETPKYLLRLRANASTTWQTGSNGHAEQVIDVAGKWGYSNEPPANIQEATLLMISHSLNSAEDPNKIREEIGEYSIEYRDFALEDDMPPEILSKLLVKKRTSFA